MNFHLCIVICSDTKFLILFYFLLSLNAGKGQQQFEISLKQLLDSLVEIMRLNTDSVLLVQAACLKFLPSTIPDVLTAFSASDLRFVGVETVLLNFLEVNATTWPFL